MSAGLFPETYDDAINELKQTLPIEKEYFGYIQKANYVQPDLHDEVVIGLDTPFSSVIASGTVTYTFLLLGDQNAGKSTFLYSFCNRNDKNFTELTSRIPILSSSFLNSRMLSDDRPFRDELPFLDTDIARASIMLTAEDFAFFLSEHGMKFDESSVPRDTVYVLLQLVEMGGDHLDRIMNPKSMEGESDETKRIIEKSHDLLCSATKALYFVNTNSLMNSVAPFNANIEQWTTVMNRLKFLNNVMPDNGGMVVFLSRDQLVSELTVSDLNRISSTPMNSTSNDTVVSIEQAFYHIMKTEENSSLLDVLFAPHINTSDGSINVEAVESTLVACLYHDTANVVKNISALTGEALSLCWNYHRSDHDWMWLNQDVFRSYLENESDRCPVPSVALFQQFDRTCLSFRNCGILWSIEDSVSFSVKLKVDGPIAALIRVSWNHTAFPVSIPKQAEYTGPVLMDGRHHIAHRNGVQLCYRFPLFKPLFDILRGLGYLPSDWWWQSGGQVEILGNLSHILTDLEAEIASIFDQMIKIEGHEETALCMESLLLLMEDWYLAVKLHNVYSDVSVHSDVFPMELNCSPDQWYTLVQSLRSTENGRINIDSDDCINSTTITISHTD